MKTVLILAMCILVAGCIQGPSIDTEPGTSFSPAGFTKDFNRLFLSDTPLRYDDSHSFLSWLDHEARMSEADHRVVCSHLKQFLKRTTPREIDPRGSETGVAPPEAVLRAYAVGLLGKFGAVEDIPFLKSLGDLNQATLPEELRYPSWDTICADGVRSIEERNR